MQSRVLLASLTRIADFDREDYAIAACPKKQWREGDYVVGEIEGDPSSLYRIELNNGRMIPVSEGDLVIGAFGERAATLEATGSWRKIKSDGKMALLTGAGLFGKLISRSPMLPKFGEAQYRGHVVRSGRPLNMMDFVNDDPGSAFRIPVILIIGTSMSSGKTTAASVVVRRLKKRGYKVLGAKLTGAGRYRDTLWLGDAGADHIFDFVDVGLPSTICPITEYRKALTRLLAKMGRVDAEIAVIELGASPLEPYNGFSAIEAISDQVVLTLLCASDPYAVVGVMSAYGKLMPDVVTGPAVNTDAGIDLIRTLIGIPCLNFLHAGSLIQLDQLLEKTLDPPVEGN